MATSSRTTIVGSRSIQGVIPSTSQGNLSWSDDGQCLLISKRTVHILTPHLALHRPPPPNLVDPNLEVEHPSRQLSKPKGKGKNKAIQDDDMDVDSPGPGGGSSSYTKVRTPERGREVKFWSTGVEVDKDLRRRDYGWLDVGNEYSLPMNDSEVMVKSAVWSPAGMTDLGGCLLAILNSHGQVSCFAPRSDPMSKQWEEVADLTMIAKSLLPGPTAGILTTGEMLQIRSMCIQWAANMPNPTLLGTPTGLLAVSDRAGGVAFWSYSLKNGFTRQAYIHVCPGWVTRMYWSDWTEKTPTSATISLYMATTRGAVLVLPITQDMTSDGTTKVSLGTIRVIDKGDKRGITLLKWTENFLVWSKPGTIHLHVQDKSGGFQWEGNRTVYLDRVGNWAGANYISPCIGTHLLEPDTLVVILSTGTYHLITSLFTSLTLGAPLPSLELSLAAREVALDFIHDEVFIRDRHRMVPKDDKEVTMHTSGWSSTGGFGDVYSWAAEPLTFHNLDSTTEGYRYLYFALADLSSVIKGDKKSVVDDLEELIEKPPNLLHVSPNWVLMSRLLSIIAANRPDTNAAEILELCSGDPSLTQGATDGTGKQRGSAELMQSIWGRRDLDSLRLKLVLASWCSTAFKALQTDFESAEKANAANISRMLSVAILRWAAEYVKHLETDKPLNARETQFLKLNIRVSYETGAALEGLTDEIMLLSGKYDLAEKEGESLGDKCPACGEQVGFGELGMARCTRGHEWARCCLTQILITTPTYRICTACPAVSLFPTAHLQTPIPVGADGLSRDQERFAETVLGDDLVEQVLSAAVACVMCGGRWMRAV